MNPSTEETYTLITGGSSGIGKAIAIECARRKMNVLLVALPGQELSETAQEIRERYQVSTDYLPVDLTLPDGPLQVAAWLEEKQYILRVLVNNAGVAGAAVFSESPLSYSDLRIQLNIRSLVLLTRLCLPGLLRQPAANIINIGSFSAFFPVGYKSVYAASKAFVVNFSLALREELRDTPVSVLAVCPSGVRTNTGTNGRIDSHGWKGRLSEVEADKIARLSLDQAFRDKSMIIPGWFNRFLYYFSKLMPLKTRIRLGTREMRKELGS